MKGNKVENKDKKFWIKQEDWDTVIAYAKSSHKQFKAEIGGQMVVVQDDVGDYIIKHPVILKQSVSAGDCTMEVEALAEHYGLMANEYGPRVRQCWWHSHHTMKAFWSGTDNATILSCPSKDWTVSLVVNLKEEYKLRIQFFAPFEHEENVELNFIRENTVKDDVIDAEVLSLCTPSFPVYQRAQKTAYTANGVLSQHANYLPLGSQAGMFPDAYDESYNVLGYANGTDKSQQGSSYNAFRGVVVELPPQEVYEKLTDNLSEVIEEMNENLLAKTSTKQEIFRRWMSYAMQVNPELVKHNLKLVTFKDSIQFAEAVESHWPDDYFINLKEVEEVSLEV